MGRLIGLHITQAVTCQAKALEYSEEAVRLGGTLTVHIKVDTGMSRLGYLVSGGEVNLERMARVLLDEFRGGKLGKFTLEMPEDYL